MYKNLIYDQSAAWHQALAGELRNFRYDGLAREVRLPSCCTGSFVRGWHA